MFPANEMIMAAEVAYRRERLMAVRPTRRERRTRRQQAARPVAQPTQSVSCA